jgi:hypothetical protein
MAVMVGNQILTQTYDDAHPVLPSNFMEGDDSIARGHVGLDSAYVCATTKGETLQDRLRSRHNKLVELLGTSDWHSLPTVRQAKHPVT